MPEFDYLYDCQSCPVVASQHPGLVRPLSSRLSEAHGEISGDLSTTLEVTKLFYLFPNDNTTASLMGG